MYCNSSISVLTSSLATEKPGRSPHMSMMLAPLKAATSTQTSQRWTTSISLVCSSTVLRSVSSRVILANPRSAPEAPKSGVITTLAQNRLPSLRTRQPSSLTCPQTSASASFRSGFPARASSSR